MGIDLRFFDESLSTQFNKKCSLEVYSEQGGQGGRFEGAPQPPELPPLYPEPELPPLYPEPLPPPEPLLKPLPEPPPLAPPPKAGAGSVEAPPALMAGLKLPPPPMPPPPEAIAPPMEIPPALKEPPL